MGYEIKQRQSDKRFGIEIVINTPECLDNQRRQAILDYPMLCNKCAKKIVACIITHGQIANHD